jgi:folate-binding protein YgfZ
MNRPSDDRPWLIEYEALARHAALVDLGQRTQIELTSADRASWFHNLCTNEVRSLPAGGGCETFLTTVQGKTLAHVFVFAQDDALVIDTVADQGDKIVKHLDRYLISERVTLEDRSSAYRTLLLAGAESRRMLEALVGQPLSEQSYAHVANAIAGRAVSLRHTPMTGSNEFSIRVAAEDLESVRSAIIAAGDVTAGNEAFEAARIEAGFPWFGRDISDANLPQEVGRDKQAISFTKGCYLGQETVARIDALGHVNKNLVGLRFSSQEVPEAGLEMTAGGQNVGHVTSATWSPRLAAPLALGYVRRGHNTPGSRLESTAGPIEVVTLPD